MTEWNSESPIIYSLINFFLLIGEVVLIEKTKRRIYISFLSIFKEKNYILISTRVLPATILLLQCYGLYPKSKSLKQEYNFENKRDNSNGKLRPHWGALPTGLVTRRSHLQLFLVKKGRSRSWLLQNGSDFSGRTLPNTS